MNMEQLIQRAAQIAGAKASTDTRRGADIGRLNRPKAGIGRKVEASDVGKRLAAYHEAVQTVKDEDPPCPDCWMHRGEELAMAPITSDSLDEDQFGCMECGFEASLPARTRRYRTRQEQHRKRSRAA